MITVDGQKSSEALWNSINWNKVRQIVNRLQTRIVKAVKTGNKEKVRSLQRLLARSLVEKLIAMNYPAAFYTGGIKPICSVLLLAASRGELNPKME